MELILVKVMRYKANVKDIYDGRQPKNACANKISKKQNEWKFHYI